MNIFAVLASAGVAVDPQVAKIHLAVHNGNENPLDVFFAGDFKTWQESQSRLNFKREKIISLIQLPEKGRWMFAGVYSTRGYVPREPYGYVYRTQLEASCAELIGRIIVRYGRSGKQSYRLGENLANELLVDELRLTALTAKDIASSTQIVKTMQLDAWASASLEALIGHVYRSRGSALTTITYEDLATRIGRCTTDGKRPWARGLGKVLGRMGRLLANIGDEWQQDIPLIQGIVVQKQGPDRGLPDDGIKEFWPHYPQLSRSEKADKVRFELARVEQFGSRWDDVLRLLGLEPAIFPNQQTASGHRYGIGGESPQHWALKTYVRDNPSLVGASADAKAEVEHVLPSLDQIDVLFRSNNECIAVEVKSSVSDRVSGDFERGIYQAIKYLALLQAMSRVTKYEIRGRIRSVLVLQGILPRDLSDLACTLSVEVIENVTPSKEYLGIALAERRWLAAPNATISRYSRNL